MKKLVLLAALMAGACQSAFYEDAAIACETHGVTPGMPLYGQCIDFVSEKMRDEHLGAISRGMSSTSQGITRSVHSQPLLLPAIQPMISCDTIGSTTACW